jgi:hypothetical protein
MLRGRHRPPNQQPPLGHILRPRPRRRGVVSPHGSSPARLQFKRGQLQKVREYEQVGSEGEGFQSRPQPEALLHPRKRDWVYGALPSCPLNKNPRWFAIRGCRYGTPGCHRGGQRFAFTEDRDRPPTYCPGSELQRRTRANEDGPHTDELLRCRPQSTNNSLVAQGTPTVNCASKLRREITAEQLEVQGRSASRPATMVTPPDCSDTRIATQSMPSGSSSSDTNQRAFSGVVGYFRFCRFERV